eukprot:TRINITY_DN2939_c0_g1_i2.p1 TRINITY_DN2939_c0_g1~~TRINITY_DN2939_c0_g1_i2.p1  ORF type:complete len:226 (+),score=45.55 TRINITY_DN2939_c0_g1_i2:94-678(+)
MEDLKYLEDYERKNGEKKWSKQPLIERLQSLANNNFIRLTYEKAIQDLQSTNTKFDSKPEWGVDLGTEHERWLSEQKYRAPVIVTDYPKEFKPFYMRKNDDNKTVAAMDILLPGVGEVVGGGQREERLDHIIKSIQEHNLSEEEYAWYVDLRKYGTVVHSGFGVGFDRLVCVATGITNIRDVIPIPRATGYAPF